VEHMRGPANRRISLFVVLAVGYPLLLFVSEPVRDATFLALASALGPSALEWVLVVVAEVLLVLAPIVILLLWRRQWFSEQLLWLAPLVGFVAAHVPRILWSELMSGAFLSPYGRHLVDLAEREFRTGVDGLTVAVACGLWWLASRRLAAAPNQRIEPTAQGPSTM